MSRLGKPARDETRTARIASSVTKDPSSRNVSSWWASKVTVTSFLVAGPDPIGAIHPVRTAHSPQVPQVALREVAVADPLRVVAHLHAPGDPPGGVGDPRHLVG